MEHGKRAPHGPGARADGDLGLAETRAIRVGRRRKILRLRRREGETGDSPLGVENHAGVEVGLLELAGHEAEIILAGAVGADTGRRRGNRSKRCSRFGSCRADSGESR
jgi:hypothetical protein